MKNIILLSLLLGFISCTSMKTEITDNFDMELYAEDPLESYDSSGLDEGLVDDADLWEDYALGVPYSKDIYKYK